MLYLFFLLDFSFHRRFSWGFLVKRSLPPDTTARAEPPANTKTTTAHVILTSHGGVRLLVVGKVKLIWLASTKSDPPQPQL